MARRVLSPEERIAREWMQIERERIAAARAMHRTTAIRDVFTSAAQASAHQPMIPQIAAGIIGAGLASFGGFQHRARQAFVDKYGDRTGLMKPGTTLGQSPWETVGEGMMLLAGARATADGIASFVGALRGQSVSHSVAYDIPDVEAPNPWRASVVGPSFRAPPPPSGE